MPLFKSNNQRQEHNSELQSGGVRTQVTDSEYPQGGAYGGTDQGYRAAPAPSGPGGFGQDYTQQHPPVTQGPDPRKAPPSGPGGFVQQHQPMGHDGNPPYSDKVNTRVPVDQGQHIPPAPVISHGGNGHSSGGTGQRLTGKLEAAIGSAIGSQSLHAKGLQKQNEANYFKLQGAELAEAERLESEARVRRERAVAHGAHPNNMYPQGGDGGFPGQAIAGQGPTAYSQRLKM